MIKTIKVKKQLRLDELIKYAWDNQLNKIFVSDKGLKNIVITINSIDFRGLDNGIISRNDTFTVEVEEEITEDTVFRELVISDGQKTSIAWNCSIRDCEHPSNKKFYTHVGGILELIWEAESDEL